MSEFNSKLEEGLIDLGLKFEVLTDDYSTFKVDRDSMVAACPDHLGESEAYAQIRKELIEFTGQRIVFCHGNDDWYFVSTEYHNL